MLIHKASKYAKMSAKKRIEVLKEWIREELNRWREVALRVAGLDPTQHGELQELLQYSLEDLPLEINNWDEGSPQHAIITHRLKHAIEPEDCQDGEVLEWEEFIKATVSYMEDGSYFDAEDLVNMKEAMTNIYDLRELAAISGDEELRSNVEQWYINYE